MGTKELLTKLSEYLDFSNKKKGKYTRELKTLLKQLKRKEKKLIEKCQEKSTEKRKLLKTEIAVLHAKRKKGLKILKQLKQPKPPKQHEG